MNSSEAATTQESTLQALVIMQGIVRTTETQYRTQNSHMPSMTIQRDPSLAHRSKILWHTHLICSHLSQVVNIPMLWCRLTNRRLHAQMRYKVLLTWEVMCKARDRVRIKWCTRSNTPSSLHLRCKQILSPTYNPSKPRRANNSLRWINPKPNSQRVVKLIQQPNRNLSSPNSNLKFPLSVVSISRCSCLPANTSRNLMVQDKMGTIPMLRALECLVGKIQIKVEIPMYNSVRFEELETKIQIATTIQTVCSISPTTITWSTMTPSIRRRTFFGRSSSRSVQKKKREGELQMVWLDLVSVGKHLTITEL